MDELDVAGKGAVVLFDMSALRNTIGGPGWLDRQAHHHQHYSCCSPLSRGCRLQRSLLAPKTRQIETAVAAASRYWVDRKAGMTGFSLYQESLRALKGPSQLELLGDP